MSDQTDYQQATAKVLNSNDMLSSSYYPASEGDADAPRRKAEKPTHYKVICISMYTKDLARLDDMVDALKARGMTKANRSALIRYALGEVNLDSVPKGI